MVSVPNQPSAPSGIAGHPDNNNDDDNNNHNDNDNDNDNHNNVITSDNNMNDDDDDDNDNDNNDTNNDRIVPIITSIPINSLVARKPYVPCLAPTGLRSQFSVGFRKLDLEKWHSPSEI